MIAKNLRTAKLLQLLLATALGTLAWFSWQRYSTGRRDYDEAEQTLQEAGRLAAQIELLRLKPDRAATESRSQQTLAEAIEKAAAAASIAAEQIARIDPQTPRRAGDTEYLEHGTVVQFDGVTLVQLAGALAALRESVKLDHLRVATLRIAAPYQASPSDAPEIWNIELALTYYVYSPKTPASRKS